ncbi:MAG: type II secretion system F family protein [Candidatus ainarchaeum sp.]|nr:type II secretion system F family protein [Candidatus ainarchaeum sp.]
MKKGTRPRKGVAPEPAARPRARPAPYAPPPAAELELTDWPAPSPKSMAPKPPVPAANAPARPLSGGLLHSLFSRQKPVPPPAAQKPAAPKPAPQKKAPGEPGMWRIYRRFSSVLPASMTTGLERKMRFAGIDPGMNTILLGRTLMVCFLSGMLPLMLYLAVLNPLATPTTTLTAIALFLGGSVASLILSYLWLYFTVVDRAAMVERLLPDFLSLAVSNLRAGMTPYVAFVHAARPEFGAFHDSVMLSMARMGGKVSIADALVYVSGDFDSGILRRTVTLFAKGVRSGGQLVRLLNSSAEEVRRIHDLRAELISSTRTYSIFLAFIVVAIMPFLLSVSLNFVTVFVSLQVDTSGMDVGAAALPSFTGKILITADDMYNISLITLVVIDLLVSILMGIVDRGKAIYGIKNFPALLALSLLSFFIAKAIIGSFLAGFMV